MKLPQSITLPTLVLVSVAMAVLQRSAVAESTRDWELWPYRIRLIMAVDSASIDHDRLMVGAMRHISQRSDLTCSPLWDLHVEVAQPAERGAIVRAFDRVDEEFLISLADRFDKVLLIRVQEGFSGFEIRGMEYDAYLWRIGDVQTSTAASADEVPEAMFAMACSLFSPVASFRVDPENNEQALLTFRGNRLPRRGGEHNWFEVGDVFLPLFRRTSREGTVTKESVQAAAWTYLQLLDEANENNLPVASIASHTRRPFGARRRGRVEQLAVRLPIATDQTTLKLHTRSETPEPLAGYQVYERQDPASKKSVLIGKTDQSGRIDIQRTDTPIRTLYVKSGTKLVAKLPLAPGTARELSAPLLDERKRIDAEARLNQFREELIDLVARRSILVSRIRQHIKKGELKKARVLLREFDDLPGRALLDQRLTEQELLARSDDPLVQKRIDSLFEDTRSVLGAFLSTREVVELNKELEAASRQAAR